MLRNFPLRTHYFHSDHFLDEELFLCCDICATGHHALHYFVRVLDSDTSVCRWPLSVADGTFEDMEHHPYIWTQWVRLRKTDNLEREELTCSSNMEDRRSLHHFDPVFHLNLHIRNDTRIGNCEAISQDSDYARPLEENLHVAIDQLA